MKISLYFCLAMVVILMLCILVLLKLYIKLKSQYENLHDSYINMERLTGELRAQRHDYLNHLQVVYGMMELEEYEELHLYLEPVYKNMMKLGKALKTSVPAVNALIKAKMGEAESKGIDFYLEVKSDLKNLRLEAWELCKVLFNLIDNAMCAVENVDGEKRLHLDITEDKEGYIFTVSNNGPEIPMEARRLIYKQGFTTKKAEGHGMGLYIVSEIVKNNGGIIELKSDTTETSFTIRLPK